MVGSEMVRLKGTLGLVIPSLLRVIMGCVGRGLGGAWGGDGEGTTWIGLGGGDGPTSPCGEAGTARGRGVVAVVVSGNW